MSIPIIPGLAGEPEGASADQQMIESQTGESGASVTEILDGMEDADVMDLEADAMEAYNSGALDSLLGGESPAEGEETEEGEQDEEVPPGAADPTAVADSAGIDVEEIASMVTQISDMLDLAEGGQAGDLKDCLADAEKALEDAEAAKQEADENAVGDMDPDKAAELQTKIAEAKKIASECLAAAKEAVGEETADELAEADEAAAQAAEVSPLAAWARENL